MEYKVKAVDSSRLIPAGSGTLKSLCNYCCNKNCSNNIEEKTVSIMGVNETQKFFIRGGFPLLVIECEGFKKDDF